MRRRPGPGHRDRAVGFQLVIMFLFLAIAAITISMLANPMDMIVDVGHETATGTEYESSGHTMLDRVWTAFTALPLIASIMALVFVIGMAVLRSAR